MPYKELNTTDRDQAQEELNSVLDRSNVVVMLILGSAYVDLSDRVKIFVREKLKVDWWMVFVPNSSMLTNSQKQEYYREDYPVCVLPRGGGSPLRRKARCLKYPVQLAYAFTKAGN
jgi:hypothetical protein